MIVINQNCIDEEIKSRLNLGNSCYHLVQNRVCSRLLHKSVEIKIYKAVYVSAVSYGCGTLSH